MKKVNDNKIYKNKYYPWYYTDRYEVNLVPVSYYTRDQATFTLSKQFSKAELRELHIIKGKDALDKGYTLGKNSFKVNGKHIQVKKYYIPEEYNFNRSRRRLYIKKITQGKKLNRSGVSRLLLKYRYKTYGTK